jgi:pimeloyl-ACP methyl ester carboxylesterase
MRNIKLDNLLLLHGALGSKSQFEELEIKLAGDFRVLSINFSGHGGEPIPMEPFSIKMFAEDILRYLDSNSIEKINIFGYSMGGYAAMYLARYFPVRAGNIFTLGTKFLWNKEISAREVNMLNYEKMKKKVPVFVAELEKRHPGRDLNVILNKTAEMMLNLGRDGVLKDEDYPLINHDVAVGIGDGDKMVAMQETLDVYNKLPNGRLVVLQNTPHPFEGIKTGLLADEIKKIFAS